MRVIDQHAARDGFEAVATQIRQGRSLAGRMMSWTTYPGSRATNAGWDGSTG